MENSRSERKLCTIVFIIMVALMLFLNYYTPLVTDDFYYKMSFKTGEPITGIRDIMESQYTHYFVQNGRSVAHILAQLFLFLPRPVFVILNSAVYAALGYLIYLQSTYKKSKNGILLILAYIAMWFTLPAFGQTVLWTDGSCNYLWTTVIVFAFLIPYRMYMDNQEILKKPIFIALLFLFGVIAGWCSENTSPAAALFILLAFLFYRANKIKIPNWGISGLIGCVIGFFIMIVSPGNGVRITSYESSFSLTVMVQRFADITVRFLSEFGIIPFIVAFAAFIYVIVRSKSIKKVVKPLIYFVCFAASLYALILSPFAPNRSFFGPAVFLLTGIFSLLSEIGLKQKNVPAAVLTGCLAVAMAFSYRSAFADNHQIYQEVQQRECCIREQIDRGEKDVAVKPICWAGKRYAWYDMTEDPDNWINEGIASYYGVNSIKIIR